MDWRGFALILALAPHIAEARVFNFKDSDVAAYVRGTGGLSALDQDPFGNSSGVGTTVNGSTSYDYGAEIGLMLALSPKLHLRIGAEVIQESPVSAPGTNSAGTQLFTLSSSVFVFNPNVALEYVYSTHGNTRFFGELGAGYANVSVVNQYTMTAAGTTALGGVGSYKETMQDNTMSAIAGLGLETLFTDNATLILDFGYRYLPVKGLVYKAPVDNIVSPGGVTQGQQVLNADGSKRTLNLGGLFGGIAFRFYFNSL
jgi:hypothetical protein